MSQCHSVKVLPHLSVGVAEEAALSVHKQVTANHDPVDVHVWDVVFQDVLIIQICFDQSIVQQTVENQVDIN